MHDFYFDTSDELYRLAVDNYDREDLLDPRWAETTLCGRAWAVMISGEGGRCTTTTQWRSHRPAGAAWH